MIYSMVLCLNSFRFAKRIALLGSKAIFEMGSSKMLVGEEILPLQ